MWSVLGLRLVNILRVSELETRRVSTKAAGNPRGICESELHLWTHQFLNTASAKLKVLRNGPVLYVVKGWEAPFALVSRNVKINILKENERRDLWIVTFIFMKYSCESCGLCRPFPAESYYVEPTRTDCEMPVGGRAFHVSVSSVLSRLSVHHVMLE